MEKILPIKNCSGYFISENGNVYSNKSGSLKKMQFWQDGKHRYLMIGLTVKPKVVKKFLIHRLVADAFIPNPLNLPEVNHKDKK